MSEEQLILSTVFDIQMQEFSVRIHTRTMRLRDTQKSWVWCPDLVRVSCFDSSLRPMVSLERRETIQSPGAFQDDEVVHKLNLVIIIVHRGRCSPLRLIEHLGWRNFC